MNDAVVPLMIAGVFVPIVAKLMIALVALAIVVLLEDSNQSLSEMELFD